MLPSGDRGPKALVPLSRVLSLPERSHSELETPAAISLIPWVEILPPVAAAGFRRAIYYIEQLLFGDTEGEMPPSALVGAGACVRGRSFCTIAISAINVRWIPCDVI